MTKTAGKALLQQRIMLALQEKNMSLKALSTELDVNYYTLREAVNDLFQVQKIILVAVEDRHRIYGLTDTERIKDKIPFVSNLLSRTQQKVVGLLAYVSKEDKMQAVHAVKYLPELITKLLLTASQAEHGFPVGKDLEALRKKAQENYLILKNTTGLYEQILEDARFWTPKYLKEFVLDPDYNYPDLVKAGEYYDAS